METDEDNTSDICDTESDTAIDMDRVINALVYQQNMRMRSAGFVGRLVVAAASIMQSSLWHPHATGKYTQINAMRKVNEAVRQCSLIRQRLARLRHERMEFHTLRQMILKDKKNMENHINIVTLDLYKKKAQHREATDVSLPVDTVESDILLLLSTYDRYNKTYGLYNDMLNLINKTLADTDITEKVAHICGTVTRKDNMWSTSFQSFEDTLSNMMREIALCDKTKEDIRTRLTLAASPDSRLATELGAEVGEAQALSRAKRFIQTGEIPASALQVSSSAAKPKEQPSTFSSPGVPDVVVSVSC